MGDVRSFTGEISQMDFLSGFYNRVSVTKAGDYKNKMTFKNTDTDTISLGLLICLIPSRTLTKCPKSPLKSTNC